jgi:two-component system chemotaxis sensor kinase CheA
LAPAGEFDVFRCNLVIDALCRAPRPEVQQVFRFIADQVEFVELAGAASPAPSPLAEAESTGRVPDAATTSRTVRIDAARIDALADIAGELVVAKNSLAHLVAEAEAATPGTALARGIAASQGTLDRLVGELHRAVMSARMAPLSQTFRRFPRLAREISGQLGKDVVFSTSGESLEADKAVVDGLFEPLLHVIRNAIDHGIEPGPIRQASGKPARGAVNLSARQDRDEIIVEVTDDGAGVDPANIRRVAAERALGGANSLDTLSDLAAIDLIFAPGFSTASAVTAVSGRGVGMDAVRSAVEKMGGRVGLSSTPGAGSTIRLTIPTTVVLTRVLIVQAGGERFGVPMQAIVETARVPIARVMPIRDGEAFVFRDRTLPILRLNRLLGLEGADLGSADLTVLVVAHGESLVGVAVDGFAGRIDVVLRPLDGLLSSVPGVRGAAVMGNGQVLMAIDLAALIG